MTSLRELGFGKTMEAKLRSVGIDSAEELADIGSRQAITLLKSRYPGTCIVILYYIEAALQGVDIKQLDVGCKAELKEFFKML